LSSVFSWGDTAAPVQPRKKHANHGSTPPSKPPFLVPIVQTGQRNLGALATSLAVAPRESGFMPRACFPRTLSNTVSTWGARPWSRIRVNARDEICRDSPSARFSRAPVGRPTQNSFGLPRDAWRRGFLASTLPAKGARRGTHCATRRWAASCCSGLTSPPPPANDACLNAREPESYEESPTITRMRRAA